MNPPPVPPPLPPLPGVAGPPAPESIPYATPAVAGGRPLAFHWGLFGWSAAVLGIWVGLTFVLVPKFEVIFDDFKLELPLASRIMFGLHRVLVSGGFLVVAAVPVVLGFYSARLSPGGRWALRAVLTILFAALLLLTMFGILVPMMNLVTGVTSAGSGSGR